MPKLSPFGLAIGACGLSHSAAALHLGATLSDVEKWCDLEAAFNPPRRVWNMLGAHFGAVMNAAVALYDSSFLLEEQDELNSFTCAANPLPDVPEEVASAALEDIMALPDNQREMAVILFKLMSIARRMGMDQSFTVDLLDPGPLD